MFTRIELRERIFKECKYSEMLTQVAKTMREAEKMLERGDQLKTVIGFLNKNGIKIDIN